MDIISNSTKLCRFGSNCTNRGCKYDHSRPANIPICFYDDRCTNPKCIFQHTNLELRQQNMKCKFYPNCNKPQCAYYHPQTEIDIDALENEILSLCDIE